MASELEQLLEFATRFSKGAVDRYPAQGTTALYASSENGLSQEIQVDNGPHRSRDYLALPGTENNENDE